MKSLTWDGIHTTLPLTYCGRLIVLFSLLFTVLSFASGEIPSAFTLEGVLYDSPTGTSPLLDSNVQIHVQVLNPAKTCILYEEQQTVNTRDTSGSFNMNMGSVVGAAKRVSGSDPGNTMATIYQNVSAIPGSGTNCTGSTYAPTAGDFRYIRLIVTPSSTGVADTLSPDMVMGSVPTAVSAERAENLQGLSRSQVLEIGTLPNLTQSNVENIFSNTNYPELTALLSGSSSLYVKSSSSGGAGLPLLASPPSSPATGSIWFNSTTNALQFYNGSSTQTIGTSGGSVTSVATGTGLAGGPITTSGTISLANTGVSANTYGSATVVPQIAVNAQGQITSASNVAISGVTPGGAASGDLSGSYPGPTVAKVQGVSVSSSAPTSAGQVLRYDGATQYSPGFIGIGDIRSTVAGSAQFFPTNCTSSQTLVYSAITDRMSCANVSVTSFSGSLSGDVTGNQGATVVSQVNGSSATAIHTAELAANAATNLGTVSTIVKRDASGNFTAGTVTANLVGNVTGSSSLNVLKSGDTMAGALSIVPTTDIVDQIIKGVASQASDMTEWQSNTGGILAKVDASGKVWGTGLDAGSQKITNVLDPGAAQDAATKHYVDTQIGGLATGVSSFNTRTGPITLTSADVTNALTYTPLKNGTDTMSGNLTVSGTLGVGGTVGASTQFQSTAAAATNVGAVIKGAGLQSADLLDFLDSTSAKLAYFDSSANLVLHADPTVNLGAATKQYVDTAIGGKQGTGNYLTALTSDVSASGPGSAAATVNSVGGSTAANVHTAEVAANAATNNNTVSTIVKRDGGGNFTAGTITANLVGTVTGSSSLNVLKAGDTMSGTLNLPANGLVVGTNELVASGGSVGIGTTSPGAQLEVDTSGASVIGAIVKGSAAQTADLLEIQSSTGAVLSKFDSSGFLTLPADPISNLQASTKQYVDAKVAALVTGVSSFNARTGAITLSSGDVTGALTYTPLKNSSDSMSGTLGIGGAVGANTQFQSTATAATQIGAVIKGAASQSADYLEIQDNTGAVLTKVDSLGMMTLKTDPTAALGAVTKQYVDTAVGGKQGTGNYLTALTSDVSATGPGSAAATVNSVGGVTAANVASGANAANAATNVNTVSTIVKRDASGNFTAGTVTANLVGSVTGNVTGSVTGASSLNVLKSGDTMTGTLNLSANGLVAGTNQLVLSGGNVGIGTTSPGSALTVAGANNVGTSSASIEFNNTTATTGRRYGVGSDTTGLFQIFDITASNATRLVINASGNVGIGTTAPSGSLDIVTSVPDRSLQVTQNRATGNSYGEVLYALGASTLNTGLYVSAQGATTNYSIRIPGPAAGANNYAIYADGGAQSYFAGNVGIGTTAPAGTLDVEGSGGVIFNAGNVKVAGQLATGSQTITSGATSTIDWTNGNAISTNYSCASNLTFNSLRDGGTYTLVVTDTGTTQCSFSATTSGTDANTVTYRFNPANAARTSSTHTVYTLMRVGTVVYVSWASGF